MLDKAYDRPTARSRELRTNATEAERLLWQQLSARKVAGVRFNRQFPIGPCICDFVSRSAKLIIEVDGGQHEAQSAKDARRTAYLEAQGYRVLRFWNNDVIERIEGVVGEIVRVLGDTPSPSPSREREGNQLPPSRLREGSGEGMSNNPGHEG
ncbi:endonuclease domain-containing protein [Sphingomonas qomolangmaensis]|uniref:Endonuclease domain-containing protein n=1 Tax=Sphingomonas qomolangmaensis TaxID=2918765 RepID=A0ABY5L8N4_9SPHN|nr:endonuclease domain-containing protein [Sphingomonas qomolangmaensis]UUL83323.1 endonuclease domain-containing protein [Sphingomonas qomolangmaensis]